MVQEAQRPIGLIPLKYFVNDLNIFNKKSSFFSCLNFDAFSVVNEIVVPRGTKSHWVNNFKTFVFYLKVQCLREILSFQIMVC